MKKPNIIRIVLDFLQAHMKGICMTSNNTIKNKEMRAVSEIDTRSLVAGDIIATRERSVGSAGVRFFTHGQASHAILYTGGPMGMLAMDAMPKKGVTREPLRPG
jgi:hypothetical protein